MAKQRRTLDERIKSCTTKEEEMLEKLNGTVTKEATRAETGLRTYKCIVRNTKHCKNCGYKW